ncbi:MAG: hypothetical protein KDA42_01135 [Planctomycetales bacterium]|nr:hypothetical protein [Planctomycetales bacterium]
MTCVHLQELYQLCQENKLKLSSSDLIHVVCKQCEKEDVCPSVLVDQYQEKHPEADEHSAE